MALIKTLDGNGWVKKEYIAASKVLDIVPKAPSVWSFVAKSRSSLQLIKAVNELHT